MKYICKKCGKKEVENTFEETFVCLNCGAGYELEFTGEYYEEGN